MTSSCISSLSSNFFPARCFFRRIKWKWLGYHKQQQFVCEFPLDVHLLCWEIVWRNTPRIWRDFGSTLPFQTRLTQTKPVLPLSNEHGSQVKDQCRRQCCNNKHKISLSAYTWCIFIFRTRLVYARPFGGLMYGKFVRSWWGNKRLEKFSLYTSWGNKGYEDIPPFILHLCIVWSWVVSFASRPF